VATALARLLLARGDADEALELLEPFEHDFMAAGLAARAKLTVHGDPDLGGAFAAWDRGDHAAALEELQQALAVASDADVRDELRKVMIAIFTELGPASDLAREHRRRLAAALN
jgi:thioredoxin-like negative regulator of GroEL